MRSVPLGPSGPAVPAVVAGMMRIDDKDDREVRELYAAARSADVDFFDHADIYGAESAKKSLLPQSSGSASHEKRF